MSGDPQDPEGDALPADAQRLAAFLDDERAHDAARARTEARWLRHIDAEAAELAGTLLDLAERRAAVTLTTVDGRTHQGALVTVGADYVCLRPPSGVDIVVRIGALAAVRPPPGFRWDAASGDRAAVAGPPLHDILSHAIERRARLHLLTGSAPPISGELIAAGADVLTVRLDGDERAVSYVSLSAVTEFSVLDSG